SSPSGTGNSTASYRRVLPDAIECVAFSDKTSAAQKFLNMLLGMAPGRKATNRGTSSISAKFYCSVRRSYLQDAALQGDCHGVRAVVSPQLREDTPHVRFNRIFGNRQLVGDDFVGVASRHLPQDVYLTLRQLVVAHVLRQLRRHLRRDALLAFVNLADDLDHL